MEEASVAGESPDRSKQHESSAEPTSGSTAPVPDPRLAVAREAVTTASRADTATAVFSTGRSAGSAKADGSAAGSSQGSDGSAERESAGKGPEEGTGGGDARLRDVVAAWVAGADQEGSEGASDAEGSDAAEGSGAAEGSEGSDGSEGSEGPDAGASGAAGDDAEVSDAPEGAAGGSDSDDGGDSGPESGVSSETGSETGSERGEGADAPADADADAAGDEPEGAAPAEAPAEDGGSASETDGADTEPAGGADAEREPDDEANAEPDDEAEDEPDDEAEDEPEAVADAKANAAAEAVEPDASDVFEGEGPADAEAAAEAAAPGDGEGDAGAKPDADAAAGAKELAGEALGDSEGDVGAESDADAAAGVDEPAGDAPEDRKDDGAKADVVSGVDESGEEAADDGGAGADSDSGDVPKPPVDQPTAIFKMPARAVDQPTTMLKLGDAKPAAGDDKADGKTDGKPETGAGSDVASDKGAAAKAAAESGVGAGTDAALKSDGKPAPAWAAKPSAEPDAERTSKFVALKPLDEPAPPRQKPAVPPAAETAAIPQVGPERTAQQPLPPKPPLDLLAELTNTPPPRETPVRTILRRVKIWTPLVLLLAVVFAVVQAVRPLPTPTLALTADESYAFEGNKVSLPWPDEGQGWMDVNGIGTMDSFGEQKALPIGSVAKAMTAYVVLKDHPLKSGQEGPKITVDALAEKEGGYDKDGESTLNTVKKGDTLTEKQAIEAIMIPSANNIARLLARWDANGSEAEFVDKMNAAAKDLGMTNTTYTDPSGLKETTVSTAEDQVKLGNELVRMQALVDITKLPSWKDPSGKVWQNYNRLVPYNNAIGIKTGSTTKAGGNLLFAATQEVGGETVIVVGAILGQHKPPIIDTVNAVSKEAMIAAQEALTSQKILKKGDVVGYVDDGLGGRTPVVVALDVSAVGWAGQTVRLKLGEDGTAIPHEAKAGTRVGSLSVGDGTSGNAVEVPVALQSDLTEPGYGAKLTRVG